MAEKRLFWASVLLLFGEILAIRWLGIEEPIVSIFPNMVLLSVLVAASAGLGSPDRYKTPLPILLAATAIPVLTLIFAVPLGLMHQTIRVDDPVKAVSSTTCLLLLIGSLIVIFINLGRVMAEGFSALPPLRAYSINLAGSIAGVIMAALLSVFFLPPPLWILAGGLICWQVVRDKWVPIATAVFIACACTTSLKSLWSPYSKLDVLPIATNADSLLGEGNYVLDSNNYFFHTALHMLSDENFARFHKEAPSQLKEIVERYWYFLHITMAYAPKHDRVLVLGGGSGNDVAYALGHGAKHIDVVEIDPIISDLGRTRHPDRPYIDPRVTVHTEDARTFLRYSKDKYDLIEFAYLDPGRTLNTASFIRVDNFVYTAESIHSAIDHLDKDGLLSISFATGPKQWVTRRLYQTISLAQGHPPRAFATDDWEGVLFFAGPIADSLKIDPASLHGLRPFPQPGESADSAPATDDWPFLYLNNDLSGEILYFGILIVAVIFPALILTRTSTGGDITGGAWGNMFFLGQSFMLVETKSITQLSLFFGATWLVTSVVVTSVLILAFIANWCAGKIKTTRVLPAYVGLAAALLLDILFKVPAESQLNPLFLAIIATLIACLPIFFGGLIFSMCFRQATSPPLYLSANLLGVAIGGLTENLCLVTGIKGLPIIAMVLYGLSFASLFVKPRRQDQSKATN
ncbi:MAG TPA: hypothetical protein V6C81_05730 [Planktothrix sp.]|jgi:hypothetical protein